jgi:hypothetical protein
MQKDVHFYLTDLLCVRVGVARKNAEKIAWANQYTDELTESKVYGIQTQSDEFGNWSDEQIQHSVLVPFHFIPGSNEEHPRLTEPNSHRVQELVRAASADLFQPVGWTCGPSFKWVMNLRTHAERRCGYENQNNSDPHQCVLG